MSDNEEKNITSKAISDLKTFLLKNKKRVEIEIAQSKELVGLIKTSTQRDLTADEQDKLQKQLLDILKTIPSFAIFMLPGGMLLLPIIAKIIPGILPSSFYEDVDLDENE